MLPKFQTRSMPEVMRELSQALQLENGSMPDMHYPALKALNCELLTSMMLDLGAAFPQVSVASLSRPRFVLGRSAEPLSWRASGFRPLDLVFLILEPAKLDLEFRQLASTLHSLGKNGSRLDDLRRAATGGEMLAVLAQVPLVAVSELPPLHLIPAAPDRHPARHTAYRGWRH